MTNWGNDDKDDGNVPETPTHAAKAATEPIYKCTALYSYEVSTGIRRTLGITKWSILTPLKRNIISLQAQNPDELSIVESEQLDVVGEGDGEG